MNALEIIKKILDPALSEKQRVEIVNKSLENKYNIGYNNGLIEGKNQSDLVLISPLKAFEIAMGEEMKLGKRFETTIIDERFGDTGIPLSLGTTELHAYFRKRLVGTKFVADKNAGDRYLYEYNMAIIVAKQFIKDYIKQNI